MTTTGTNGTEKAEKNAVGLRVWAPAKVNLFFEILFKRDDGFHEIQTVATPIGLCDELEFWLRDAKTGAKIEKTSIVECVDAAGKPVPGVPLDDRNLIIRAAQAFDEAFGEPTPVSIRVVKRIPSQAGLGGGSSDAAATLAALNELRGRPFSNERLREIGGRLGSDVPLFLLDGASVGRSRGEIVEPFDLPEIWLVVLKPTEGLSTPAVFRRYVALPPSPKRSLDAFCAAVSTRKPLNGEENLNKADKEGKTNEENWRKENGKINEENGASGISGENGPDEASKENGANGTSSANGKTTETRAVAAAVGGALFNRLEEVAATIWDGVARYRALLAATRDVLGVQMSGSGTAFFAIYPSEAAANDAAEALRRQCVDGETVAVARTLAQTFRFETLELAAE
ncbi:MAG: 4-(cytidine 5'-diphospho)-2-C-methyl-D-erythritol kinase [Thermoguttaceae bacterium]|nr:4-(cytidine 5'-diphospho)-2-C-methyl-D-erythritol kinase [Thermoguttaceae bacterium]